MAMNINHFVVVFVLAGAGSCITSPAFSQEAGRGLASLSVEHQALIPVVLERAVIERFKNGYAKLGKPRVLLQVTRDSTLDGNISSALGSLNVEAAFGRPFREAGVIIVKQSGSSDQAAPPAAGIRIQIALSAKPYVWSGITLATTNNVIDASSEALASDGQVLGHSMTSDFMPAAEAKAFLLVKKVGVEEVVKATALALMDDIMMTLASNPNQPAVANATIAPLPGVANTNPSETEKASNAQPGSDALTNSATAEPKAPADFAPGVETDGQKSTNAPTESTPPESNVNSSGTNSLSSGTPAPSDVSTNFLTTSVLKALVQKSINSM